MKKVLLPVLLFCCIAVKSFAQPATPAPTPPAKPASNVVSVYGTASTNVASVNTNPGWGQAGSAQATTFTVSGDVMLRYPNFNYQGIEFTPQNLNSLDSLHLDIWTPNCDSINITIIGTGERLVGRRLTLNAWNSINIPLSAYRTQANFSTANIFQFKFERTPSGGNANLREIFVDNLYFFTDANLPTISNFSIPSKAVGDAPFAITPPTSNSSGAFSYMSSNTNVATISGNMITIVGGGTSVITATQAAAGSFGSGSISTNLIVSVPPPNVAAPAPPLRAASDVVSLFSDAFTSAATMSLASFTNPTNTAAVVSAAGNNVYALAASGGDFHGFDLSNGLDLTNMTMMHYDIWIGGTTNVGAVFNTTLSQHGGGHLTGQTAGYVHTNIRSQGQEGSWLPFDIALSTFSGSASVRNIISQLVFSQPNLSVGGPVFIDNIYFYRPGPLPVKLSSFTAVKKDKSVVLNWQTATETNNKGFAVERSADGQRWNEFSFVKASGSNTGAQYQANDATPQKGMNFYRLKQVDNDGQVEYSDVKAVNFNDAGGRGVLVYPNPARGVVKVFTGGQIGNTRYSLISADGRVLKSGVIAADSNVYSLDVSTVAAGTYVLKLNGDNTSSQTKLILY